MFRHRFCWLWKQEAKGTLFDGVEVVKYMLWFSHDNCSCLKLASVCWVVPPGCGMWGNTSCFWGDKIRFNSGFKCFPMVQSYTCKRCHNGALLGISKVKRNGVWPENDSGLKSKNLHNSDGTFGCCHLCQNLLLMVYATVTMVPIVRAEYFPREIGQSWAFCAAQKAQFYCLVL